MERKKNKHRSKQMMQLNYPECQSSYLLKSFWTEPHWNLQVLMRDSSVGFFHEVYQFFIIYFLLL